LVSC